MKKIDVELEGITPLLMHKLGEVALAAMKAQSKKTTDIPIPEDEAEDGAYRKKDGELYIPARCIKASLLRAAGWYKIGKKSMKQYIAGCITIEPHDVGLGTDKYEIDVRPVVIGRGNKILRARPRIDTWKVKFNLIYNEDVFKTPDSLNTIRQILEEAGMRCGLLDNRPEKNGENGIFKVVGWKAL